MKTAKHLVHLVHIKPSKSVHLRKPFKNKASRGLVHLVHLVYRRICTGLRGLVHECTPLYIWGVHHAPKPTPGKRGSKLVKEEEKWREEAKTSTTETPSKP